MRFSLKSEKPESALEKCDRFRHEGSKYYKNFEEEKTEQERFYKGEHFKNKVATDRPKNYVFQIIESEIPLLMDPMPATNIIAHDDQESNEQAVVLEAAKSHVYREQNLFLKDAQAIRQSLKTGVGYQYVDFDADGEYGEGSICVKNLSRKQVIIDPAADVIDQARYVIIDSALSNEDLERRFPKTAGEALSQPLKDIYVFSGAKGLSEDRNLNNGTGKNANRYDSKDMTFIEEFWIKDYSMEEISDDETQIQLTEESAQLQQGVNPDISKWENHEEHITGHRDQMMILASEALQMPVEAITEQDMEALKSDPEIGIIFQIIQDHIEMHAMYIENMDQDEIGKRPKYPNHLRLIIKTGKVIHFDGAPDVDDGMIPLVPFECYKDEGPAEGAVKHIIPMQKTVNELDAKELKGLKLVTNPGWVKDEQSGVDSDTLTDEDGIVVTKEQGTEVNRLPPGQVSPQLENRSVREYEAMQRIEGVGETVFGEAPKAATSGIMYRRLQMQALGRIRLKSKMIEAAIYRRDKLIVSRIIKYWSTERKLRAEDANGKIRFVKFDPRMMRDFSYSLILAPGTMAGMDNETIAETYKELLLAGAIDVKTYATIANIPKKQALLDILEQNDQTASQLQSLQQQNLELKAQFAPQLLTPDEVKQLEEMAAQQPMAQP